MDPLLAGILAAGALAALTAVGALVYLAVAPSVEWRREQRANEAKGQALEAARLARQCDEQDAWWLANDPRGTFGRRAVTPDELES
jgi:hypothetical protein